MAADEITMRAIVRAVLVLVVLLTAALVGGGAPGAPAGAAPGDHCYVAKLHQVFLGRAATDEELRSWKAQLAAGTPRWTVPRTLSNSDEWLRVEVARIYRQALDREPDAAGLAFWTGELRRGVMVTRAASLIYGSPEFVTRAGSTNAAVISDMYRRLLHRGPAAGELSYWVAERSRRTFGGIAADLVFSPESRTDRVTAQFRAVLGRDPDASGLAYWVGRLRTVNDVRLASDLAASQEMFDRAQVGCTEPVEPGTDAAVGQATSYRFEGRGYGHGRGMGQWGAYGYAVQHGWSTAQILDHFYGGTTTATLSSTAPQRVYLVGSAGTDLTVTQTAQRLRVDGSSVDWAAVSVRRLSASTFRVYGATTASCSPSWTLIGDTTAAEVRVASSLAQGEVADRMLRDCRTGRSYRGALRQIRTGGTVGSAVVNEVGLDDLVRGVVPSEVSPSWADAGGGRGAAAVRAQAVAARSYAAASDTRWGGWATTCDSTSCQAYRGFGVEDRRTDAAVAATAGQVRRSAAGVIVHTEFSSSSGGWTAGGTFPAVIDEGDAQPGNSNHQWSVVVTRAAIEAAHPGRGALLGMQVKERNGLGELGGRVRVVELRFATGTLTRTGDQLRSALGLRSDWFRITTT